MPKYPYRELGVGFDRNFRNDLNANFADIEADIKEVENNSIARDNELDTRIDNIVAQAGTDNTEIVDARYDSVNNVTHPTLKDRLDSHSNEIGILSKKNDYPKKQTELLSSFYRKITKGDAVKIVCQGDSITYGQDTVSSDKRPADTTPADNGTTHTFTRAGKTYPEALQENLQAVYGTQVTVINKGYSGDWVEASFNRWNKNSNADIALIMLGTNDSNLGASWVPSDVKGNLTKYIADMRNLIERFLDWNTAVMLLTPPRLYSQEDFKTTTSHVTESYRNALFQIGKEYNIPVIDAEEFLNGFDATYYSDSVHLNTKGYTAFASRLTSVFIGMLNSIPRIKSGDSLGVRVTRDNFIKNSQVILSTSVNSFGAEEGEDGQGILCDLNSGGWIHYSFITEEENLVLIPTYSLSSGGIFTAELDFGVEQGSYNLLSAVNKQPPQGEKPLSIISSTSNVDGSKAWDGTININTTDRYLLITQKGLHNIKVSNTGSAGSHVLFNGFVVVSFKDFLKFGSSSGSSTKNNYLKINIPSSYVSPAPSVASYDLPIQTLLDNFSLPNIGAEYYKGTPLKITLMNTTTASGGQIVSVLEYAFIFNDTTVDGTTRPAFAFLGQLRRIDVGPTAATDTREISSITYDGANDKYVINFSGKLDIYSTLIITLL
jgi:lysophospholipase L1-like esterase